MLKAAKQRGVADAVLTAGTSYDVPYLRDQKNRIEWEAFCQILRNARTVWSLDELQALNESFTRSPMFSTVGIIARILFTARDLFAWMQKRDVGGGAQLFGDCVRPSYEHVGADTTIIRLEIIEPYEISQEFFWMTRGAFVGIPRLVGAGTAKVDMTIEGRIGTFRVQYKNRRGTVSALVRLLRWPFTARAAARELQRSNEELQARFYEPEDARSKIDRQATQLHTAHVVNELVQRDLDLARTLETIVKALVDEAGFTWAQIATADCHSAVFGAELHDAPLVRELVPHGGSVLGTLRVAARRDGALAERNALLDFIVPNLSMAVENASYRTNLERLVEARTAELREAQGARERFFAHISHEIRTPLTIITLAASDVAHRARDVLDGRAKKNLDAVTEAARKLVRLVDELLLLAAGQEGKLTTHPEPTNLVELMRHIEAAWQLAAEPAGLTLTMRAPASLVANVDPIAMERVITNLVSNAVKYTPRGGHVELELVTSTEGIRISVFDTGPGISDELASRLFGRYERAANATATGTGLGLALSRQLVNAHRGTIDAHRRPEGGAELRVFLPRDLVLRDTVMRKINGLRLVDQVPLANRAAASAEHAAARTSQGTILLAEDDVRLAELVAASLSTDYTVVVAHDGLTALELAKRHHPHLLITDVDMPGLDGLELSRRFRELAGDRLAPIVILSAMLDLGTRVAGLEAGAIDYVTKPFDPLELRARVAAQFRARDLAVRLHRAEQLSSLGVLTAGLAHELRNPANAIVNAIDPLVGKLPAALMEPGHPAGQLVGVIRECAEQIRALSKHLLGMRSEAAVLDIRETPLSDVIHRALLLAQQPLRFVDVRVEVSDVILKCAPPLLTQVITNLVENAADAAGPRGWVEIRASIEGDCAIIEIADSGPGVPSALRERVFEPFFTTKAASGTGLGLSLAREIVERHAGTLEIHERGEGTAFVVRIPGVSLPATSAGAI
ncbi:MAG TPA: HAMP domain-containing sensor histidine kinase [Kofleriaceae bacterium]|nr:HAMP domain-containing sensor histidine kinase [Kofleriaceae bacterium]